MYKLLTKPIVATGIMLGSVVPLTYFFRNHIAKSDRPHSRSFETDNKTEEPSPENTKIKPT